MENWIEKITELQKEVGYEKGNINNIALLGLFGEAGEVINECRVASENDLPPQPILPTAVSVAENVDSLKKKIRDKEIPPLKIIIEDEEKFDKEMADVFYYLNALALNRGKTLNDYAEISYKKVMRYKLQKDIKHANVEHGAKSE